MSDKLNCDSEYMILFYLYHFIVELVTNSNLNSSMLKQITEQLMDIYSIGNNAQKYIKLLYLLIYLEQINICTIPIYKINKMIGYKFIFLINVSCVDNMSLKDNIDKHVNYNKISLKKMLKSSRKTLIIVEYSFTNDMIFMNVTKRKQICKDSCKKDECEQYNWIDIICFNNVEWNFEDDTPVDLITDNTTDLSHTSMEIECDSRITDEAKLLCTEKINYDRI